MRAAGAGTWRRPKRDIGEYGIPADEGGIGLNAWTATALGELTSAEREVADLLPIEADPADAEAILEQVPYWFHTFALNRAEGIYAPGTARDHRYRIPAIPESFEGLSVLDIGTFDGFYAFLAEARGADRVVAVDNEQYIEWVRARWGVDLEGGEGFRAIHALLDSGVEYRKLDALDLDRLAERFDFIFCCGILHRVEAPARLLRLLCRSLALDGRALIETHGVFADPSDGDPVHRYRRGAVYPHDEYVYWGFAPAGIEMLGRESGLRRFELVDSPVIDGHPRIIGWLRR
jgi:tRNA (mo5U34)-methyltransferase